MVSQREETDFGEVACSLHLRAWLSDLLSLRTVFELPWLY